MEVEACEKKTDKWQKGRNASEDNSSSQDGPAGMDDGIQSQTGRHLSVISVQTFVKWFDGDNLP